MTKIAFQKPSGESYLGDSLELIQDKAFLKKYKGKINLIFTSPPFSLISKKKYGNEYGNEYILWLKKFAKPLTDLLTEDGSIVIEIGNAWEKGTPTFSTVPIEALLEFKKEANLHLCQEFICHNPGRLPSPAAWVTVERIRVKDSFTRIWWLSKNPNPKSDNRNILVNYSASMRNKIKKGMMHSGKRPSGHYIRDNFYNNKNVGSISPNFLNLFEDEYMYETAENTLSIPNSSIQKVYNDFCVNNNLQRHPARMQIGLSEFFIRFLTDSGDIVFDPFGGSNTTGMVSEVLKREWVSCEQNIDYIKGSLIRFFDENKSKDIIARMAEDGIRKMEVEQL